MNYIEEARKLVQNLDNRMGPSPYDIAWLARLRDPLTGETRWPDLIEWLLEHQHPDGSWGGEIVYYHDRIICTLAAALALNENRHWPAAMQAIRRAERYLWNHLHWLTRDPFELVGFELIFPTLLDEAHALGLDVPTHTCDYGKIQTAKLRLIPPDKLYSPRISTVHSLEFLGRSANPARLYNAVAVNGSLGNSPATTAYYLMFYCPDDERAWSYLETTRQRQREVIYLYPCRTFELTWVLKNLSYSQVPLTRLVPQEIWEQLRNEIGPTGIGLDATFGIPDGDITSVCCQLLIQGGYQVEPAILNRFENKETHIFRTYDYERNISIGTNVHALETLSLMPDYPNRYEVQEHIMLMLLDQRKYNVYWVDKWHASPYYATSHALVALLQGDYYLTTACRRTIDWILHTQRDNGAWGFFEASTAEETAYALIALLHYNRHEPVDRALLQRGAAYLAQAYEEALSSHPELWLGKCLYIPYDVVRSAILAALILYTELFGYAL